MKIAHDTNGNKVLVIESADITPKHSTAERGFSVQTLGNLPNTHRDGVTYETKQELFEYVDQHGTERQRHLLNCDTELSINDINKGTYYSSYAPVFRSLTDKDLDELTDLLGGRKKTQLRAALQYNLEAMPHWAAERLTYTRNGWSYCAGQDYPHELGQIRKALIN